MRLQKNSQAMMVTEGILLELTCPGRIRISKATERKENVGSSARMMQDSSARKPEL
jgi:hypothetical protein